MVPIFPYYRFQWIHNISMVVLFNTQKNVSSKTFSFISCLYTECHVLLWWFIKISLPDLQLNIEYLQPPLPQQRLRILVHTISDLIKSVLVFNQKLCKITIILNSNAAVDSMTPKGISYSENMVFVRWNYSYINVRLCWWKPWPFFRSIPIIQNSLTGGHSSLEMSGDMYFRL